MTVPRVVCLALGGRRVGATAAYAGRLAAGGADVVLVIATRDEWDGVPLPPAATVHRLPAGTTRETLRSARRLLLGPDSPVPGAGLLIAGDPEAMPVAWALRRRHPGLPVRLEPSDDPARRTAPADLAVLTPWYPSPADAFAGAFVQATAAAVGPGFDRVAILHTESWFYSPQRFTGQLVGAAAELFRQAVVLDTAEGELTRVAVPTASGRGYLAFAEAQARALAAALPTGRIEAPVVHAHIGMLGGIVATRLARPDARIVVTEHATFLPLIFEQEGAQQAYARMLDRADALLCVGRSLFDQLSSYFPDYAAKLAIVPNAIDFERFAVRPQPPRDLSRWLYAGRLMEHKGVLTLVDGFARIAAEDPSVTLTLVGAGPAQDEVDARIAALGLGGRVTWRPPVAPQEVTGLLHEHDLLVHASRKETFGMTVVEAIATGTPVLVAGSDGPRETMAGLDGRAGLLIEPVDDPEVIAEGYRRLRDRLGELDLPAAREVLIARYGSESVAARLRTFFAPERPPPDRPPAAGAPADRVVVVAVDPRRVHRSHALVRDLAGRGIGVDLIVSGPRTLGPLDPLVRVHDLAAGPRRPRSGRARSGTLRSAARTPGPLAGALIGSAERVRVKVGAAVHDKVILRGYAVVRARLLWRAARREALPRLDLSRVRRVIVADPHGARIGAELGRRCPRAQVTTAPDLTARC
ncbi:glycosyltransferase family 4 protein [Actinoplanes sp. NPDC026623]|uniref:glycosyltransferase family 4 protein n=1 Tax=Actinoplanes sp. NPDC026623 TaxID=3155610 RepID=UPI0033F1C3A3